MERFTLKTKNISKTADRKLIDNINFCAYSGEIHAIIGNNGEGKTVFAQILAGIRSKNEGSIFIHEKEVHITNTASAQQHGIYMLQQEVNIFPDLSIRDNLISGNEKHIWERRFFAPTTNQMNTYCHAVLASYGFSFDLNQKASTLDEAHCRIIQLIRTLICKPKILILDEFSTFLNYIESEHVFRILEDLKLQNVIIILITHNYSEVCNYCDRVSFITDGSMPTHFTRAEFETEDFLHQVANLNMIFRYPRLTLNRGKDVCCIQDQKISMLEQINFTLHECEILGITGLSKSEKKALTAHISSHTRSVSLLPEKNSDTTLFMNQSIPFNIVAANFKRTRSHGLVSTKKINMHAKRYLAKLGFHNVDILTKPNHLSSGNRQKLIIARSLFSHSKLYIYDEPTKNLDATSRLELYNILNALALNGASILIMSSDIPELIGMCSRIILFKKGMQIGNYSTDYLSSEVLYKQL